MTQTKKERTCGRRRWYLCRIFSLHSPKSKSTCVCSWSNVGRREEILIFRFIYILRKCWSFCVCLWCESLQKKMNLYFADRNCELKIRKMIQYNGLYDEFHMKTCVDYLVARSHTHFSPENRRNKEKSLTFSFNVNAFLFLFWLSVVDVVAVIRSFHSAGEQICAHGIFYVFLFLCFFHFISARFGSSCAQNTRSLRVYWSLWPIFRRRSRCRVDCAMIA